MLVFCESPDYFNTISLHLFDSDYPLGRLLLYELDTDLPLHLLNPLLVDLADLLPERFTDLHM